MFVHHNFNTIAINIVQNMSLNQMEINVNTPYDTLLKILRLCSNGTNCDGNNIKTTKYKSTEI